MRTLWNIFLVIITGGFWLLWLIVRALLKLGDKR